MDIDSFNEAKLATRSVVDEKALPKLSLGMFVVENSMCMASVGNRKASHYQSPYHFRAL